MYSLYRFSHVFINICVIHLLRLNIIITILRPSARIYFVKSRVEENFLVEMSHLNMFTEHTHIFYRISTSYPKLCFVPASVSYSLSILAVSSNMSLRSMLAADSMNTLHRLSINQVPLKMSLQNESV